MNWSGAMPVEGFVGGLMIGLAAVLMLLGLGRIAGVSGMAASAIRISQAGTPWSIASTFVVGLPLGAWLVTLVTGSIDTNFPASNATLILGGLVVGFGTRLGSGCTSGHGVCGLSRFSTRSIAATALFMASGFATVAVMRLVGLSW